MDCCCGPAHEGMGKTSIALTAADQLLYDYFDAEKVLVVAPLRVAEDTWSRESAKWDHLRHLRISKVLGSEKQRLAALEVDADIYVINRENVAWLVKHYGLAWPFDTLVIDELSNYRSPSSQRFRALKRIRPLVRHVCGLTGTPRPRSLLDLWAEVYLLDQGERLGKTYTAFRDKYFRPGRRNGYVIYDWVPRPGAEDEVYGLISDLCISMDAQDYLKMPELVRTVRPVVLSPEARELYDRMERDAVLALSDADVIDAGSAAAVNTKLLQIAGGAVYDDGHHVHKLHEDKLDVLEDVLEEADGEPVLVAYSYQHERDRIMERFPQAVQLQNSKTIEAWNRGEIPLLLAHPAGAGHGLNLQDGGHIIVWYGPIYDQELHEQFIDRLYRQGQRETTSVIYLVAEGTVDEDAMRSLDAKADSQQVMMEAVKVRLKKYVRSTGGQDEILY